MEKLWHWIKSHPYIVGGVVLGGAALLFLMGNSGASASSSSSGSATDPAVQAASINAEATVQAAQIAAGVQTAQTSAQSAVAQAQIAAEQAINANNNQTSLALAQANNAASLQAVQIQAATQVIGQEAKVLGQSHINTGAAQFYQNEIFALLGSPSPVQPQFSNNMASTHPASSIGTGSTNSSGGNVGGGVSFA